MKEEKEEPKSPPFLSGRLFKILTLTLFFIIVLFSVGFLGLETTSSSKFCSSCHEMKPEYYTWKASSHSEVDCVSCHTGTTKEDYAKAKANGLVQVYKTATQDYIAPIKMPNQIENSSCEKCHNMSTRNVSASGDLIIPHDKHKKEKVACIKRHSGVAHGKIAERKVTYRSDYGKWNEKLGKSIMSETKFLKPQMGTCVECHALRKVANTCETCHETTMLPDNHKKVSFKTGDHGKIEPTELKNCDKCHSYMSKEKYQPFEKEKSSYTKFINKEEPETKEASVTDYAKVNTFCKDCHSQRPASHKQDLFLMNHGRIAENTKTCFACHDDKIISDAPVTSVACSSCHASSHQQEWKQRHPVPVIENQKFNRTCTQCHVEETCTKCHSLNDRRTDFNRVPRGE
jgi:nitrate/TMAO reductase-like tetraheme cytochrome c subunit